MQATFSVTNTAARICHMRYKSLFVSIETKEFPFASTLFYLHLGTDSSVTEMILEHNKLINSVTNNVNYSTLYMILFMQIK